MSYRGRFAPTPSGPLHLGSLLTALASYLQARAQAGVWLLRIDDLDRPRCVPGADAIICRQLEAHGLHWDESPRYQSRHLAEYENAMAALVDSGAVYACHCTRSQLSQRLGHGPGRAVYDGYCRAAQKFATAATASHSLRLAVEPIELTFSDGWQGPQHRRLDIEIGDFVLRRADGVVGYQLACVVDEEAQRITEVVRGIDLLDSSMQQMYLQQTLRLRRPDYRHLLVLHDANGNKLSKQNHAAPIDVARAGDNLLRCLHWLNQHPPAELFGADVATILQWAIPHWESQLVPRVARLTVE